MYWRVKLGTGVQARCTAKIHKDDTERQQHPSLPVPLGGCRLLSLTAHGVCTVLREKPYGTAMVLWSPRARLCHVLLSSQGRGVLPLFFRHLQVLSCSALQHTQGKTCTVWMIVSWAWDTVPQVCGCRNGLCLQRENWDKSPEQHFSHSDITNSLLSREIPMLDVEFSSK